MFNQGNDSPESRCQQAKGDAVMMSQKRIVLPVLFLTAVLAGCLSSSTDSGDNGNGAGGDAKIESKALAASADSVLSIMLAQSDSETPISSNRGYLKTAESLYREAAEKDPSNSEANFGAALSGFQLLLDNSDLNMIVKNLETWNTTITDKNDPRYLLARYFLFGESEFPTGDTTSDDDFTIDPMSALTALISLVQGSLSNPDIVSLTQLSIESVVIPRLDQSISYMDKVLGDKTFQMMLNDGAATYEMDLGDAYLLSGSMRLLRGSLKMLNAYQFSITGATKWTDYSNPTTILPLVKSQDLNGGSFLTLRNKTSLPAAKTDFITAINNIKSGINSINSETDDQSNDAITPAMIAEADSALLADFGEDMPIPVLGQATTLIGKLDALTSMMNGTFTVNMDTGTDPVTVNLSAFLANGIPDLKKVMPYHTWTDLSTSPVSFEGSDIETDSQYIGGKSVNTYRFEVLDTYSNYVVKTYEYAPSFTGTFTSEGVFTVTGIVKYDSNYNMVIEQPAANVSIADNGSFYLDSQKRLCITDAAWTKLKTYTMARPTLYFERVADMQATNFSITGPFGTQGTDRTFRFAGTINYYSDDDSDMVYLTDKAKSGVRVTTPVFPDPTFGGLLPGMTQTRIQTYFSEPDV